MMLEFPIPAEDIPGSITLTAPAFDEKKLLIYRELYYDGFSSIIAARDLTTGAALALKNVEYKYLVNTPFPTHQLQRRFSRKVRNQTAKLRSLSHNSVLKIVDFVIEPRRLVVVTEMCMFGDLFNWMLQQPQLRIRDISIVFQYVFEAIRYLHSQDFIHGVLSPTHILFQAMSPQSVTIMPDLSVRNELLALTTTSLPVVDCWAPECLEQILQLQSDVASCGPRDDQTLDYHLIPFTKPMDIWSAACIMHIALTGKAPFSADSLPDLIELIRASSGRLDHPLIATLSPNLRGSLSAWLQMDPNQRTSTDRSFEAHWYDDELIRSDDRNVLLIIEYDLMHTCKRYRTNGRHVFDSVLTAMTQ